MRNVYREKEKVEPMITIGVENGKILMAVGQNQKVIKQVRIKPQMDKILVVCDPIGNRLKKQHWKMFASIGLCVKNQIGKLQHCQYMESRHKPQTHEGGEKVSFWCVNGGSYHWGDPISSSQRVVTREFKLGDGRKGGIMHWEVPSKVR